MKEFTIEKIQGNQFRAFTENNIFIIFTAEYKNGLYFNIQYVTKNNRCYFSTRYHKKYIMLVREVSYLLLCKGELWDYVNNTKALTSYLDSIKDNRYYDYDAILKNIDTIQAMDKITYNY